MKKLLAIGTCLMLMSCGDLETVSYREYNNLSDEYQYVLSVSYSGKRGRYTTKFLSHHKTLKECEEVETINYKKCILIDHLREYKKIPKRNKQ